MLRNIELILGRPALSSDKNTAPLYDLFPLSSSASLDLSEIDQASLRWRQSWRAPRVRHRIPRQPTGQRHLVPPRDARRRLCCAGQGSKPRPTTPAVPTLPTTVLPCVLSLICELA